jgi:hypothetical protein
MTQIGIIHRCAWCMPPIEPQPGVKVSHGICDACAKLYFPTGLIRQGGEPPLETEGYGHETH